MKRAFIKIFLIILVFVLNINFCHAKHAIKMIADVDTEFTAKTTELPDKIYFKTVTSKTIPDVLSIPEGSVVGLEVIKAQRELRWHKSGIILCKLSDYTPEGLEQPVDVSDKDIYLVVRKYEKINKKEAFWIGTELILAQGASFFAPGVDIGYFFIKGAIQRKKHPNWFKAGVHNAYDNSICWFWLKGKPIELDEGQQVSIKDIKPNKVDKLMAKIDKRNARFERQAAKRIVKKERKTLKRDIKNLKKMTNCSVVEDAINDLDIEESVYAELVNENLAEDNEKTEDTVTEKTEPDTVKVKDVKKKKNKDKEKRKDRKSVL